MYYLHVPRRQGVDSRSTCTLFSMLLLAVLLIDMHIFGHAERLAGSLVPQLSLAVQGNNAKVWFWAPLFMEIQFLYR